MQPQQPAQPTGSATTPDSVQINISNAVPGVICSPFANGQPQAVVTVEAVAEAVGEGPSQSQRPAEIRGPQSLMSTRSEQRNGSLVPMRHSLELHHGGSVPSPAATIERTRAKRRWATAIQKAVNIAKLGLANEPGGFVDIDLRNRTLDPVVETKLRNDFSGRTTVQVRGRPPLRQTRACKHGKHGAARHGQTISCLTLTSSCAPWVSG